MNIQARKQALRRSIIAARDNLTPTLRAHASKHIVDQLCKLATYKASRIVLGYLNFGSEVASEAWVRQALTDGKCVLLPRVNKASKHLELFEVKDIDSDVETGAYGIREPIVERCDRFEALGEIDLILMPGVAFDWEGGRLGYGGGYFDRLLAHLPHRPVLIAGAFAMQVVKEIPQESTDHKIDWLVTENETIRCNLERE
ncbi:MAG: 5-formyltetrahydrofolate cyclo-ligase [Sideroxydans sp.]|nr:5-formyltetrahydrofolate cyclo-ligase [Sideroxydans sp.]